ncbi:hypothetical protein [Actinoplanes xinjiangensis]|uniref:hypothetical protein n=1 Tax=Actinoplanes xinjiangensis TaxID=512350 RepID=UPI003445FCDD
MRVVVMALLVAPAVAGCARPATPASIRKDDVVGEWASPEGGLFRFAADGTFGVSDLRGEALLSNLGGRRLGGSGTWRIGPAPLDGQSRPDTVRLQLDLADGSGRWGGGLNAEVDRPTPVLFFFLGDPDSGVRYEFTRVPAAVSSQGTRPSARSHAPVRAIPSARSTAGR